MALSTFAIIVLVMAGIVALLIILYFLSQYFELDFFGIFSNAFGQKKEEMIRAENIPDDEAYRIINERYNFNELVSGYKVEGKDEKTGKDIIRFKYGENLLTDWSVPLDVDYFKINTKKNLSGKRPIEYIIASSSDTVVQLKKEVARLELYARGLQNKLNALSEDEKLRMQKTTEYHREEKRVALGYTSTNYQTGYTPFRPYRSWANPMEGGGEEQM